MTELFADVNGIKICYEIHGEGKPVILIHGFGSTKDEWKLAQVGPLSEKYKIIIMDNRGAGKSDHPDEPYLMETFADDINYLMEHLKIDKSHIIGLSLGGMIAQTFAINYNEKVDKLILINTTPNFPSDPSGIEMYKQSKIAKYEAILKDVEQAYWDYGVGGFSRKFRKELKADPKKKIHGLFSTEDLIMDFSNAPSTPQDSKNQTNALLNFNVVEKLPTIKNKTLIITASHDKSLPKSKSELIHEKIPNSKLVILEGVGHGSCLEKAPKVNKLILDFLEN